MDYQVVIVPALTVLFQAIKKIAAIGEDNQYIPLVAVVLGGGVAALWSCLGGLCDPASLLKAVLEGFVFGAASVGLYELLKA